MTLTEALAHVRNTQMLYERTAAHHEKIKDDLGQKYYDRHAQAMGIVLDEVNRLSKELLVAVSQR